MTLEALPFAKPRRRITDKRAIAAYIRSHPRCELKGCKSRPCPEPHHLISRKMGGDDVAENLIRLCPGHHMLWHTVGGQEWLRRLEQELSDEARQKLRTALRLED